MKFFGFGRKVAAEEEDVKGYWRGKFELWPNQTPQVTPPDQRVWENPDPRIQWALDTLDPPGPRENQESHWSRWGWQTFGFWAGVSATFLQAKEKRLGNHRLLGLKLLCGGFGALMGEFYYKRNKRVALEEMAAAKHYIMLHPERFIEPEAMKLGDKRYFHGWNPKRTPG